MHVDETEINQNTQPSDINFCIDCASLVISNNEIYVIVSINIFESIQYVHVHY